MKQSKTTNLLEIKKSLNSYSTKDLISLITELYSFSKSNKDFLEARFLHSKNTLESYKEKIQNYLAPDEPWRNIISIKDAKKVISDYKKATGNMIGVIDLMVYYVECGTDFILSFGDAYEQYYMSLESVFDNAIGMIKQNDTKAMQKFIDRLSIVVKKAEPVGWGYYDTISEMFNQLHSE